MFPGCLAGVGKPPLQWAHPTPLSPSTTKIGQPDAKACRVNRLRLLPGRRHHHHHYRRGRHRPRCL